MENRELEDRLYEFLKGEKLSGNRGLMTNSLHRLDRLTKKKHQPDKKRMWGNIYKHVVLSRRRMLIRRSVAVAAVLIPGVIAAVLFLHFRSAQPQFQPETAVVDRNQVQLFLNDGRVVHVQQLGKDSLLNEKGTGILVDTSRSIVYQAGNRGKNELVYNTLSVPRCCEYHIVLADGTQVWLNSDSELRYPVDFVGNERRVFLKGEGYFEVAKDVTKPFRVEADRMVVEALGTTFDVNVYRDGGRLAATLLEGRVRVTEQDFRQECILDPGYQAVIQEGKLHVGKVNVNDIVGWKEGRFVFSNMTLEEIACQLERWYDVKVGFQDVATKYERFTGVVKRYNQLSQLTELIEETTNLKFEINGREVKIRCR